MTEQPWTVALAGSGEVTPENAIALLDDWLPVEGVSFVFPKLPRNAKTLRAVAKWAEAEKIDVHEAERFGIGFLEKSRAEGDQVYLVLAWDDTEASSKLLEQALEAGIQVKDLTRALDDLEFEDDNESDEPVTVAEGSGTGTEQPEDPTPVLDDSAEDNGSEPADGTDAVEVVSENEPATPSAAIAGAIVQAITTGPATVNTAVQPLGSQLVGILRAIIREEIAEALKPPEKREVPALMDEDGNYRLGGKGRPRKGETATVLTPSEAKALGLIE